MLEQGLLEEAKAAFEAKNGATAVQAIGHKEFFPYFNGEISLQDAVENLKTETRRYAKRQMTWLRSMQEVTIMDPYADLDACQDRLEAMARAILEARSAA